MGEDCCSTQLIDGNGVFNASGLENFVKTVKLAQCGVNYAVVSIMGPRSSGKSTLVNRLFRTNFREMDASKGRSRTTNGIWIAKCIGIEPFTIVMDLEGTDGRDRGEDDTAFEKQSALFALAISDIVLINIWCHDIGREHAASNPLLKTVFQVMMRLFSPRKTTLLFVIRDKTKTPHQLLESHLKEDIQKIWDTVSKPQTHKDTPLSEFFRVEVTALSSYEEKEKQFNEQVQQLKQRFSRSIAPGGLAGDRRGVVPASGFSFSVQQIWKVIKENKDLDLPTHKVMVATVRCEEVSNEKFNRLISDELWLELEATVQSNPVSGFGKKLSSIIDTYLTEYDMETVYFDERVRAAKREQLKSKALHLVQPTYHAMLEHLRSRTLFNFKNQLEQSLRRGKQFAASVHDCSHSCMLEFDQECADVAIKQADWDTSKVREKLLHDIEAHATSVHIMKLSEIIADYKEALRHDNNWMPPPWAIVAMIVLGFNEFSHLLRNPLYLLLYFIIFLLMKALWLQLDVTGEFQNGILTGMLSLSSWFLSTVMKLLKRNANRGQMHQNPEPPRQPSSLSSQSFRSQTQRPIPMTGSVVDNLSSLPSQVSSSESGI